MFIKYKNEALNVKHIVKVEKVGDKKIIIEHSTGEKTLLNFNAEPTRQKYWLHLNKKVEAQYIINNEK